MSNTIVREVIITAKTVEAAIEEGSRQLGASGDNIAHEVLEEPKKGFIGLGAQDARVRVWILNAGAEGDLTASEEETDTSEAVGLAISFIRKLISDMNLRIEANIAESDGSDNSFNKPGDSKEPDNSENETEGEEAVEGHDNTSPGATAAIKRKRRMREYCINLKGEDAGALIGHHGDVLEAVQYLCNLAANNKQGRHIRVLLDVEQYKEKRIETLQALARRMAQRVLQQRSNLTLEPMSPFERRVIHAEIQGIVGVSTHSVGQDQNRKVVITFDGGESAPGTMNKPAAPSPEKRRDGTNAPNLRQGNQSVTRGGSHGAGFQNSGYNSAIQGDRGFKSARGSDRSRGSDNNRNKPAAAQSPAVSRIPEKKTLDNKRNNAPAGKPTASKPNFNVSNSNGSRLDDAKIGVNPRARHSFFDNYDKEKDTDVFDIDLSFHTEHPYEKGSAEADGILPGDREETSESK